MDTWVKMERRSHDERCAGEKKCITIKMRSTTASSSSPTIAQESEQQLNVVDSGAEDTEIIPLSDDEVEVVRAGGGKKREYKLDGIWTHFERIAKSNVKSTESRVPDARCKAGNCNYFKKSAKILELHYHLAYECKYISPEHRDASIEFLSKDKAKKPRTEKTKSEANAKSSVEQKQKQQSSIRSFVGAKVDLNTQKALDLALCVMIVMCGLSFSIVENTYFILFLSLLRSTYVLPSRDYLVRTLLPCLYSKVNIAMENFFKTSNSLFTVHLDGWTDNSKNSIVGISATDGINRFELSLLSLAVGADGETAQKIFSIFESVAESIGLRKIVALCTDNASVMNKARSLFVQKYPHVLNFRCIPHLLSLFLCDLIKHKNLVEMLTSSVRIVTYFSKSTKAFASLKALGSNVLSFKKFLKVRWGSILFTFNSLLHNKISMGMLIQEENKKKRAAEKLNIPVNVTTTIGDLSFWKNLENYSKFLSPIKVAIKLCESKTLFVADTFYIFALLGTGFFDALEDSTSAIPLEFRRYVVFRFLHRWGELMMVEYGMAALCYVLHPAYRMKGIFKRFIENDVMLETIVEDNGTYIIVNRLTKCLAIYGKNLGLSKDSVILLIKEFRLYACSEGNYASSYNLELGPRIWWLQMHESPLQEIALRLLQIKPNSAGLENIFSLMSILKPLRRNRMRPDTLGSMTKIRKFYENTYGNELEPSSRRFGVQELQDNSRPRIRFEKVGGVAVEECEAEESKSEVFQEQDAFGPDPDVPDEDYDSDDGISEENLGEVQCEPEFKDDVILHLEDFKLIVDIESFKSAFANDFDHTSCDDADAEEAGEDGDGVQSSQNDAGGVNDPIKIQNFDINDLFV